MLNNIIKNGESLVASDHLETNITAVRERVAERQETLTRHRAWEVNSNFHLCPTKDFHLYVYKNQLTQQVLLRDHAQQRVFTI